MSWNLNSLAKNDFERVDLIEAHNNAFNYDLISLGETSLNSSVEIREELLKDYTFVSANHPSDHRRGGVGLFYKNSLPIKIRNDLSFSECIVVELKFGKKKIFFSVLYRSPANNSKSPEFQMFLANFEKLHLMIKAENPFALFFAGDFNAHSESWWPEGDSNEEGTILDDLFIKLGLSQLISDPTNIEPLKNASCIDLILTDQPNIVLDSGTRASLDSCCHHQITHCKVNFRIPPPLPFERRIWYYNRADVDAIKRSMNFFPWHEHLNINADPNWQVKNFTRIFLNIMSNFIPNEKKRCVPRDPPWITKHLKSMLNRKNRLYKNYKKHGYKDDDKIRLDLFRIECQEGIKAAKSLYLSNLGKKANDPYTSQKSYWKIINKVMNKCRAPKIPPILVNSVFVLASSVKARLFNDFFSRQCTTIVNNSVLPVLTLFTDKKIENISVENHKLLSLIRHINPNKAAGPDGISGKMLLLCDDSVTLPLQIIFCNILSTSIYPDEWKIANVTPVFKKGNKQLINNYRPISLLPICGKLLEKLIFSELYCYLNNNNLITKNQSGFRPGDSTTNQLIYLINEIQKAFNSTDCLEVRAVFLDISKAFDKVWHEGLIFKLEQNGVSGRLLTLFESYLRNRKQRVALNGSFSQFSNIESGVPQGSILGPLLFLIYINDLEKNIKSSIKFFADDTMLFSIVKNPDLSALDLNHDLEVICNWAHQWKLEFNPDPKKQANEVLFSCKKNTQEHPPIYFNGSEVTKVKKQIHLGFTLEPSLSFKEHISEKIKKAKRNIGLIKHISSFLPLDTLTQIYKTIVRPHLDYCDVIYHSPTIFNQLGGVLSSQMDIIESVQYRAALAITGAWQGTSCSKLYEELGWESLADRRWCRRILHIHKIVNNMTPEYLRSELPCNRRPCRPLYRRNNLNIFQGFRCNSDRYKNSFFPNGIDSWNNIIRDFSIMPTLNHLKTHILSLVRPVKKILYKINDPVGLRYLFQLRLGLSPLRSHKNKHGFADTPTKSCLCNQGDEDTNHFLLLCPLFTIPRAVLMVNVNEILQRNNLMILANQSYLYLYGHRNINYRDNKKILLSTIDYIKNTQRF